MGQLGIRIANVALFTVCCFQVASVLNEVSADFLMPGPTSFASFTPPAPAAPRDWSERAAILDRNLFGAQISGGEEIPEPEVQEELEETKLPVKLIGTHLSSVRKHSKAAIANRSGRKTELLYEGDTLEEHPQARLVRVERGRVILDNRGRREELLLAEEGDQPRAPRRPARAERRQSRHTSRRAAAPPPIAERLRNLQPKEDGDRDMASIFSQGRLTPSYEDGQFVGMELQDIEAGSLYEKVGLKDGDVITSVNGIELDSAAAAAKLLPELATADQFEIETTAGSISVPPEQLESLLGEGDE